MTPLVGTRELLVCQPVMTPLRQQVTWQTARGDQPALVFGSRNGALLVTMRSALPLLADPQLTRDKLPLPQLMATTNDSLAAQEVITPKACDDPLRPVTSRLRGGFAVTCRGLRAPSIGCYVPG